MSYDLYLYRTVGGATVAQAHAECADHFESDRPGELKLSTAWEPVELEGLATLLMSVCPGFEMTRLGGPAEGTISVDGPVDAPVSWGLSPMELSVAWPYGRSREEFERIFERVRRGLDALQGRGARVFDPQLDRELDPQRDFEAVAAAYEGVNRQALGAGAGGRPATARKAWWKFW